MILGEREGRDFCRNLMGSQGMRGSYGHPGVLSLLEPAWDSSLPQGAPRTPLSDAKAKGKDFAAWFCGAIMT